MTSNADYGARCDWCGAPIAIQESGQWGHVTLGGGLKLRFWCLGRNRVRPSPNDGSRP